MEQLETTRLRENNPYSDGVIRVFQEGDYLLEREPIEYTKNPRDRYYTVKQNDDLWSIAHYAYGDSKWWWLVRDVNGIDFGLDLEVGKTLLIPDLATFQISRDS